MTHNNNNNCDDSNNNDKNKTPRTTEWEQIQILCRRNLSKDMQKPLLWSARTLGVALMLMLYTVGIFLNGGDESAANNNDSNLQDGDFILFQPEAWTYPQKLIWNLVENSQEGNDGMDDGSLMAIDADILQDRVPKDTKMINWNVLLQSGTDQGTTNPQEQQQNFTAFQEFCQDNIEIFHTDVCVFVENFVHNSNSTLSGNTMADNTTTITDDDGSLFQYRILYGGGSSGITPYEPVFAGTQHLMTSLFIAPNGNATDTNNTSFDAVQIQKTPKVFQSLSANDIAIETRGIGLTIGMLTALALVITAGFVIAPVLTERKQEVTTAFVRVGVRLRTYMFQWMMYLCLNSIVTAAALTVVAIVWNFFPLSSGGLIFGSYYLVLVQLDIALVLFSQVAPDEEFAGSASFLFFLASVVVAAIVIFVIEIDWVMSLFSVISPYIGIINFSMRYYVYDVNGYGTGIHADSTFVESGLLGSYLGSFAGVLGYFAASVIFSTPRLSKQFYSLFVLRRDQKHQEGSAYNDDDSDDEETMSVKHQEDLIMEPLTSRADVLLHTTSLQHTYFPGCCAGKDTKPSEVLQGVDMDVCRNSVLGLLGHNGCGKSTTIKILSGELELQEGLVQYNFLDGLVEIKGDDTGATPDGLDIDAMKRKIGVCPQHNNLLGDESCRETLRLFASLRGNLPQAPNQSVEEAIEAEVNRIIAEIDFTSSEDADKPVKTYSGGMKRKVSIGIALIGDPEIVFLDEPSAGLDPYNRRTIWDLIIAAKKNRSIVLCSHHLEEVDLLSDRVAIMNEGKIVACGSPLFLKHHYGGYSLRFEAESQLDVSQYVRGAVSLPMEKPLQFQWKIEHGSEPYFANLLTKLDEHGAKNVALELTTLEQVFLETSKEDYDFDSGTSTNSDPAVEDTDEQEGIEVTIDQSLDDKTAWLSKIWEKRGNVNPIGFWAKFFLVQDFMNKNAWRQKGAIIVNITFPLIYMVAGLVVVYLVGEPEEQSLIKPDEIPISPAILLREVSNGVFFGVPDSTSEFLDPIVPAAEPENIEFFADDTHVVLGGLWTRNETLQYNSGLTPFALQLAEYAASIAAFSQNDSSAASSLNLSIQQLPYISEEPFRIDFLLLPVALVFGFTGMVMSVLDILTIKANKAASLFRVAGVNEWTVYLGVMYYKCTTTFIPFFALTIILSLIFKNVLLGNGGRWLASILTLLLFAYSSTPIGLLIGKRFIHRDFDSVKGWFPAAYFTLISLPYLAWNLTYQNLPEAQDTLLIVGDFLCLIPPVAFQRSLGAIIQVSPFYDDPDLSWGDVWEFETRVFLSIVLMFGVGTLEWIYLYRLTTARPQQTPVKEESDRQPDPIHDEDVLEEKGRSIVDDDGINARELVKVFEVEIAEDGKKTKMLKKVVKGLNFGTKKNEIYVLLGPNGAGKTSLMSTIAAEYAPEHGSIAIDGRAVGPDDKSTDHVFGRCNVSWCPQEDALFPELSVEQHLEFYARIRGLDWGCDAASQHIDSIVRLLGLSKHIKKHATELSGGYKRRLSLAIAMIGYPTSMLVDECTTGVDPGARHLIWGVLQPDLISESYSLPAILLSTHYMDEAAKLASRIGIMINGELVASGSLDRLQQRYCGSYFIEIALREDSTSSVEDDTVAAFETKGMEASIYESIPFNFKLQVPFQHNSATSDSGRIQQLISIFDLLEAKKEELRIQFYSVAQMSLEQIFIDLSRRQFDADESMRDLASSRRY